MSADQYEQLPDEMKVLVQWCAAGAFEPGLPAHKAPINPHTGRHASVTDRTSWGTFEQAVTFARLNRLPFIGFVLTDDDPYSVIDLDTYKAATDEVRNLHREIIAQADTYTEKSQSALGTHIICRGHIPHGTRSNANSIEIYATRRFMICTGNTDEPRPITNAQDLLDHLYNLCRPEQMDGTDWRDLGAGELSDLSDEALLDRARRAENGVKFTALFEGNVRLQDGKDGDGHLCPRQDAMEYSSQSEADLALCEILSFYSPNNEQVARLFSQSALGQREKARRRDYLPRTIARARALIEQSRLPPIAFSGGNKRAETETAEMSQIVLTRVSDVAAKPVTWLWSPYLAVGKVTILAGHPGLGKSQLTAFVAAKVTIGSPLPNSAHPTPSGSVIMLSCEDDIADTIRPRLEAVCADLAKVHILEAVRDKKGERRLFSLKQDMARLEEAINRVTDVRLVIVDPVTAYLDGTDTHKTSDVRAALAPLQEFAMRRGVAILAVSHLNKNGGGGDAVNAVTGSGAFVAAARGAFLVAKDPEDPQRRLLLEIKNNLGRTEGLAFRIKEACLPSGINAPFVEFEEGTVEITADEALQRSGGEERPKSAVDAAMTFLIDRLRHGPRLQKDLMDEGEAEGHSVKTIRRAKDKLGIVTTKQTGKDGGWRWAHPASELGRMAAEMMGKMPKDAREN